MVHDFFDQRYQLNYWPFYQVGLFSLYQTKPPQSNLSCVFSGSAFRFFPEAHSAHLAVRLILVAEIGHEILKLFFATKQTPFYFGVGGWTIPSYLNQDIFTKFRVENQSVLDFAFRFNVLLGSFSSLWRTQLHFDLAFSLATKSLTQNRTPSETIGGRMKRTKIGY